MAMTPPQPVPGDEETAAHQPRAAAAVEQPAKAARTAKVTNQKQAIATAATV